MTNWATHSSGVQVNIAIQFGRGFVGKNINLLHHNYSVQTYKLTLDDKTNKMLMSVLKGGIALKIAGQENMTIPKQFSISF